MYASIALAFALPILAAATAVPRQSSGNCNTGNIMCCSSVESSSVTGLAELASEIGLSLGSLTPTVGLTCSSITVVGGSGTSCSAQPACCTGNTFSGLITLGCDPLNLNL